ncbi:BNR-4 repeat-containing protein [Martelella mangrovi]|uniref:Uncharacterized protein n=1 Tax=Martelella mangrovi TaxID=1397477 RepID=A0ABV2IFV0_9HYPH
MKTVAADRVADLGLAWAGSSVNCKPYAVEPIVRTGTNCGEPGIVGTFFDFKGRLSAYSISDDLSQAKVAHFDIGRLPIDAHDSPVIQCDSAGRIMIMASAHRSRPVWLVSDPGAGIAGLTDRTGQLSEEMNEASYPSLLRLSESGSLLLLYRLGVPDRSHWRVTTWDPRNETWQPPRGLLSGMTTGIWPSGPYPNQPIPLSNDRFGIAYCWRSTAVSHGHINPMNIGMDYVEFTSDLSSAYTSNEIALSVPVSPTNTERIIAVPWGAELMNQSGACAIDGQTPCFATLWKKIGQSAQVRFCWLGKDRVWRMVTLTNFSHSSALEGTGTLPTPVSRPVVVPAGDGRVIVLFRTPEAGGQLVAQRLRGPDFNPQEFPPLLLVAAGLDQYEPVAERLSSAYSGWLHVYIQRCSQLLGGDLVKHHESAAAQLCSWRIEHLFNEGKT